MLNDLRHVFLLSQSCCISYLIYVEVLPPKKQNIMHFIMSLSDFGICTFFLVFSNTTQKFRNSDEKAFEQNMSTNYFLDFMAWFAL